MSAEHSVDAIVRNALFSGKQGVLVEVGAAWPGSHALAKCAEPNPGEPIG